MLQNHRDCRVIRRCRVRNSSGADDSRSVERLGGSGTAARASEGRRDHGDMKDFRDHVCPLLTSGDKKADCLTRFNTVVLRREHEKVLLVGMLDALGLPGEEGPALVNVVNPVFQQMNRDTTAMANKAVELYPRRQASGNAQCSSRSLLISISTARASRTGRFLFILARAEIPRKKSNLRPGRWSAPRCDRQCACPLFCFLQ